MCPDRSLYCLSSSSTREPTFSYLLKARNKHEWTSERMLFQPRKDIIIHNFSRISPPKLIYCPVWYVCRTKWRIWRYDWSDRLSLKLFAKGQFPMDKTKPDFNTKMRGYKSLYAIRVCAHHTLHKKSADCLWLLPAVNRGKNLCKSL